MPMLNHLSGTLFLKDWKSDQKTQKHQKTKSLQECKVKIQRNKSKTMSIGSIQPNQFLQVSYNDSSLLPKPLYHTYEIGRSEARVVIYRIQFLQDPILSQAPVISYMENIFLSSRYNYVYLLNEVSFGNPCYR